MPEGDTIHRTAATLRRALAGTEVTDAHARAPQLQRVGVGRLVGQRIDEVEARGKHLLVWFAPSGLALHSHMRMSGSWHLYRHGERWRRGANRARVRLDTAAWVAVCFDAPVCELLSAAQVDAHPSLAGLGPDATADGFDRQGARRRLDEAADRPVGEVLLDQRVVAGVGNVYRCELCFIHRLDPWAPVADLDGDTRDAVLASAERLLRQNTHKPGAIRATTGADAPSARLYVYGKARRPCPRCRTPIAVARQGSPSRVTYWCPGCQGPGHHGRQGER